MTSRLSLSSLGLFLSFALVSACSQASAPAPDEDTPPEPLGSGTRQSATLTLLGSDFAATNSEFSGAYDATTPDASFIRCSYGNDPDVTGEKRVLITVGYTGRPNVAEIVLRNWSTPEPTERQYVYDSALPRQEIGFSVVRSIDSSNTIQYSYREDVDAGVKTNCHVVFDTFSGVELAGSVACDNLIAGSTGSTPISATLAFECPLVEPVTTGNPGTGGSGGSAACADGETQACLGNDACAGTSTCSAGVFGTCVCPNGPRLLLKLLTPSTAYEGIVEQSTGSYLESTAQTMGQQGYVVTSGTANTAPYTLWGVRPVGSTVKYEAMMDQTDGSGLAAVLSNMGSLGFVPTAGMANTVPYSIIAMKPVGSTEVYETKMVQTDGSGLSSALTTMGAAGYIPVIGMANTVPYTIVGVKKKGSTKVYTTSMKQTDGSGLDATAALLTSGGYVITVAMQNSVPYTLIGVKDATESWTLTSFVTQSDGSGLTPTMNTMSSSGYLTLATTGNPSPYTFYGTKLSLP